MSVWALIKSILLVVVCSHPIVLTVVGFATTVTSGKLEGLLAVLATPMTLAFFGIPTLFTSFFVIPLTYYAFAFFGRRELAPFVVFAIGAAVVLYLVIAQPPPSGAIPGYDQTAQGFAGASLMLWALYAYFRLGLRPVREATGLPQQTP